MKKIEVNTELTATFIGDSKLKVKIPVISITATMCTVIIDGKSVRKKIYNDGEKEYIYPYGNYSMAPIAY